MQEPICTLIVDSCCDLPYAALKDEGVVLLQFPFIIEGVELYDDLYESITAHEFYEYMRKGSQPTTMQITVPALTDAFEHALKIGKPTVYLSFTSGLSGSFDTACMVRDAFLAEHPDFELHVVDTKLASIAEGVLVLEAIRQREKGLSAEQLAAWAEEARFFVNEEFMVDDLEALRRGGRIPGTVAAAGAKLDVKPLLTISLDGRLSIDGVARGRKKGLRRLAEHFEKHRIPDETSEVLIGCSDCEKDAMRLEREVLRIDDGVMIVKTSIGPVIGSHVGPGMVAIAYMGRDAREDLSLSDRIARKIKGR